MRNSVRMAMGLLGASALMGATFLPASAADTTATAEVAGGVVAVSAAPDAVELPKIVPGDAQSVNLPGVKVTDTRAGELGWKTEVTITDFNSTNANREGGAATIAADNATYTAGGATVVGTAVVTSAVGAQTLSSTVPVTVQSASGVVGNHTAEWTGILELSAPANALAGTYTATVTHSAA